MRRKRKNYDQDVKDVILGLVIQLPMAVLDVEDVATLPHLKKNKWQ